MNTQYFKDFNRLTLLKNKWKGKVVRNGLIFLNKEVNFIQKSLLLQKSMSLLLRLRHKQKVWINLSLLIMGMILILPGTLSANIAVLAVGDSITHGWETEGGANNGTQWSKTGGWRGSMLAYGVGIKNNLVPKMVLNGNKVYYQGYLLYTIGNRASPTEGNDSFATCPVDTFGFMAGGPICDNTLYQEHMGWDGISAGFKGYWGGYPEGMLGMLNSYLKTAEVQNMPANDGLVAIVALGTNDMQEILKGKHGKTIQDAINNIINPNNLKASNTVVGKIISKFDNGKRKITVIVMTPIARSATDGADPYPSHNTEKFADSLTQAVVQAQQNNPDNKVHFYLINQFGIVPPLDSPDDNDEEYNGTVHPTGYEYKIMGCNLLLGNSHGDYHQNPKDYKMQDTLYNCQQQQVPNVPYSLQGGVVAALEFITGNVKNPNPTPVEPKLLWNNTITNTTADGPTAHLTVPLAQFEDAQQNLQLLNEASYYHCEITTTDGHKQNCNTTQPCQINGQVYQCQVPISQQQEQRVKISVEYHYNSKWYRKSAVIVLGKIILPPPNSAAFYCPMVGKPYSAMLDANGKPYKTGQDNWKYRLGKGSINILASKVDCAISGTACKGKSTEQGKLYCVYDHHKNQGKLTAWQLQAINFNTTAADCSITEDDKGFTKGCAI